MSITWDKGVVEKKGVVWDDAAPESVDLSIHEPEVETDKIADFKKMIRASDPLVRAMKTSEEQEIAFGKGMSSVYAGLKQLYLENFGDPETLKMFNEKIKREDEIYNNSDLPDSWSNKISLFLGEATPYMAVGTLAPTVAGTGTGGVLMRTAASSAAGGATSGAMFVNDGESRLSNLYKGMAMGAFGQGVVDAFTRLPRFVATRYLSAAQKTEAYKEADNLIKHVKDNTGIDVNLDLYQMSLTPSAQSAMIAEARSPAGADFLSQRAMSSVNKVRTVYFKTLAKYANVKTKSKSLVANVHNAFDGYVETLKTNRNNNWQKIFNDLPDAAKKSKVLDHFNTKNTIDDIILDLEKPLAPPEYKSLLGKMLKLKEGLGSQGKLSVEELQYVMEKYGKLASPKNIPTSLQGQESVKMYGRVFGALKDDLDSFADDKALGAIGQTLKTARDRYRVDSGIIDEAKLSTLGKMLGKPVQELNVETVSNKIASLSGDELKFAHKIFNSIDTQVMKDVAGHTMKKAWNGAVIDYSPAGMPNINLTKFIKDLPSEEKLGILLNNPGARQDIIKTVKLVDRVSKSLSVNAKNPVEGIQNIAGIAGSGDTTFINIFLAKTFGPKLFRSLATNEGRAALQTVLTSQNKPVVAAAMAVLAEQNDDFIPVKEQEQQDAK